MKILVTGGAGFIGSNVVDGYVRDGHEVMVVDNLYSGKLSNVNPKARFFQIDIRSPEAARLIEKEKPDLLNHHAAQMSVPKSVSDPVTDADINIKGFLNLLEACVRSGVKKVVFISSGGAIYGEASEYPTSEDYRPRPLSPYAISKYASEYYLGYYKEFYGLEYTTLRYSNIYGPRQVPHGEAGVVAIFMNNLLASRISVVNHFPGDSQGMIRDYCYVDDVVKANIKAIGYGNGHAINIGTGVETKTSGLYETVFSEFAKLKKGDWSHLSETEPRTARPGDLKRSCLMVKKAREVLKWFPETELRKGIYKTWEWRLSVQG